jgi:exodeoxyribonuclease VII small subunit
MSSTSKAEQITFESGYEELKSIVARLGDEDVSVHEMFECFRRGKGLENALRAYLQEREGELAELEEGKNVPAFEIVAPSSGVAAGPVAFEGSSRDVKSPPGPALSNLDGDEIPF